MLSKNFEDTLDCEEDKRELLNTIRRRKTEYLGHIMRNPKYELLQNVLMGGGSRRNVEGAEEKSASWKTSENGPVLEELVASGHFQKRDGITNDRARSENEKKFFFFYESKDHG